MQTFTLLLTTNQIALDAPIGPLWFLIGSILMYLYMYIAKKYKIPISIIFPLPILIYIIGVFDVYDANANTVFADIHSYRISNYFIFFLLGYIIASTKESILKIKESVIISLSILILTLSYIEFHELISFLKHYLETYYMLPFFVGIILILCIKFPNITIFEYLKLHIIGKKYALYIYLIHMFYLFAFQEKIQVFNWCFQKIRDLTNFDLLNWLQIPTIKHLLFFWLLICLLSLLTAVIVEKIVNLCSPLFHKIF
jgi:hypothetical protein